jgi:DNA-binding Lrp family transcriptional regulator
MHTAYTLINAELGSEDAVVNDMKRIPEVKEVNLTYGVYDIVAKIQSESMDRIKEIITLKVRKIDKIRSTLTLIVTD